jgi:hypothetical protein
MPPVTFPVRLSAAWRVFYVGVGVLCVAMAAESAGADLTTQLLAWGFFGVGGVLVLKLVFRNSGSLTLREDGLIVDTHWSTGFIPWEHLAAPRRLRLIGLWHLGLSTTDPEGYLHSRAQLTGLANETDRVYAQGFMRGMIALLGFLPPAKMAVDMGMALFGWSPMPKSTREEDLMAWQEQSYGAQIAIPRMWLADFEKVLAELQLRARGTTAAMHAPAAHESLGPRLHTPHASNHGPRAELKTCPMCAENVQQQARICRFCRYSFDEQRLLPSA